MADPVGAPVICLTEYFSADRTEESGKSKGGGVCFITNNKWCNPKDIKTHSRSCSPNLEHLTISCHPFYLPWDFIMVIITAVNIPPLADTDMALSDLHDMLCRHQTQHPNMAVVVARDFNRANLKKVMPNVHHQRVLPGEKELWTTATRNSREATRLPLFLRSEEVGACRHSPAEYEQRIVWEAVVTREVKQSSDQIGDDIRDTMSIGTSCSDPAPVTSAILRTW